MNLKQKEFALIQGQLSLMLRLFLLFLCFFCIEKIIEEILFQVAQLQDVIFSQLLYRVILLHIQIYRQHHETFYVVLLIFFNLVSVDKDYGYLISYK